MRRLLDGLYRLSGYLAGASVVGICALVCAQVGLNVADTISTAVAARSLGLSIPSYAELAGYCLASASFLALAPTWRSGGHIRVTLVLDRLDARHAHWAEIWAVGVVTVMTASLAFYTGVLCAESWRYGDVSPGLVSVPLWLPQAVMTFGLGLLMVAQIDSLIELLTGRRGRVRSASFIGSGAAQTPARG